MSATSRNIVFAISDTGGGHRSGAAAIIAALDSYKNVSCPIIDLLRVTDFPLLRQAPEIYDYCSKNVLWLNNFFFRKTNSVDRIKALTRMVFFRSGRRIEEQLANSRPDAVVAVHPLVIGLLQQARLKSGAAWPIITVVTDLVTIHASWATPGADLYLVPTRDAYESVKKYGVPDSRIIHTGFPVHPKFTDGRSTRLQARRDLGLDPERFTVLFTSGGVGAGNMNQWISTLVEKCHDKQLLIVTGNNKQLYSELRRQITDNERIKVYGFVDNMETLMTASDVIVSKAGPGTIMEGVATGRPLIITEAVGIQESGNIDYIQKNQLGCYCPSPEEACAIINRMSQVAPEQAAAGRGAADAGGADRIAATVLEYINEVTLRQGDKPADVFRGA